MNKERSLIIQAHIGYDKNIFSRSKKRRSPSIYRGFTSKHLTEGALLKYVCVTINKKQLNNL